MALALSLFLLTAPAAAETSDEPTHTPDHADVAAVVDQDAHRENRRGFLRRLLTQRVQDTSPVRTVRQSAKRSVQESTNVRRDAVDSPVDNPRADGPSP